MGAESKPNGESRYPKIRSGSSSRDKRAAAFLNDVKVLVTLAETGNKYSYAAEISRKGPDVQSIDPDHPYKITKPGVMAACRRLENMGVLESRLEKTPKKKRTTPHFRIIPTLDALNTIYKLNGPGALATIASTAFGRSVVDGDLTGYIDRKLKLKRDIAMIADSEDLLALRVLLGNSGHALIGFLNRMDRACEKELDEAGANRLVKELKDAAFLALLNDLVSRRHPELTARDLKVSASLVGRLRIRELTLELEATYEVGEGG